VPGDQRERVNRSATAGEDVHRSGVERGDQAVEVVRVLVGVDQVARSARLLRETPRGSYVTTVRFGKCMASVLNPLASIGQAIINNAGALLSASAARMP
jgi:hypothetical protein